MAANGVIPSMSARDRLRITFVLPHAGMAGGIRVLAIYAQRLRERGHDVRIVSRNWIPPGRRGKAWARVRRWLHRADPRPDKGPLDPSHFDALDIPLTRVVRDRPITDADVPDADVVVATWWETAHWVHDLSARKGAKAYFVQDYGAHIGQSMEVVAATWHLPLHKIAISRWIMSLISEHCEDRDVDYVPNAVDLEQFYAPLRGKQSRPTVGMLYYLQPQKGCEIAIKAIEIARRTIPQLEVVSYGPSEDSRDLPLPPRTRHWTFAPDDQLKDIYASCDAWLFASRKEGFGLPILEAMACRTPVIATPAGAAPELIAERGGGVLVRPNDAEDMAAAIVRVTNMADGDWLRMSEAAYATATRFTWNDATDLFERSLYKAIRKSRCGEMAVA
jgi:glycosyltransferase involved in cell wall biosynthesis